MKLFGGIDGGGSKTLAVVVDETGREIGRGIEEGSNCQVVGNEEAARRIIKALQKASGENPGLRGVCIGLAGVDRPEDREGMLVALEAHRIISPEKIWLGNDAELILLALPGKRGVGLIAGTGSIAFGIDAGGKRVRSGGWGNIIGDEGSGFDLGRKALIASARAADGRAPFTLLLGAILSEWKLSNPQQIVGVVYGPQNKVAGIARLAPLVLKIAREGDPVAVGLMDEAVRDLAGTVEVVARQLDFQGTLPGLALGGGLILSETALKLSLLEQLRQKIEFGPVVEVNEPAFPAALSARDLFKVSHH